MVNRLLVLVFWGLLLLSGLSGLTIAENEAMGERIPSFTNYSQVQPVHFVGKFAPFRLSEDDLVETGDTFSG